MRELSSAEFRRTFAGLTESVIVTVHGHAIATYTPIVGPAPEISRATAEHSYNSFAEFRPAPKPVRKKR